MTTLAEQFLAADSAYNTALREWNALSQAERRSSGTDLHTLDVVRSAAARALIADAGDRHHIEERAVVWLTIGSDGWEIDTPTFDGSPLEGYDNGPLDSECDCDDEDEHHAVRKAADLIELPTAGELADLLQEARLLA